MESVAIDILDVFRSRRVGRPRRGRDTCPKDEWLCRGVMNDSLHGEHNDVFFRQGSQSVRVGTDAVSIFAGASEKLRVGNTGNVGIGTTNPSSTLQVQGNIVASNQSAITCDVSTTNASLLINGATGGGSGMTMYGINSWFTQWASAAAPDINPINRLAIGSYFATRDSSHWNQGAAITFVDVNTNPDYPTAIRGGALAFHTMNGGTGQGNVPVQERMRITPNGNVGIGTTYVYSETKLSVWGRTSSAPSEGAPVSSFNTFPTAYGGTFGFYSVGHGSLYYNGTHWLIPSDGLDAGGSAIVNGWSGNTYFVNARINQSSGASISDANIAPYVRMIITSDGKVGIGTGSPTVPFEVRGFTGYSTPGIITRFRSNINASGQKDVGLDFHIQNGDSTGGSPSGSFSAIQSVMDNVAYTPLSLNPNGGNVAVGTSIGLEKFHVHQGNLLVGNRAGMGGSHYISVEGQGHYGDSYARLGAGWFGGNSQGYASYIDYFENFFFLRGGSVVLGLNPTSAYITVPLSQTSDIRLKKNIESLPYGLETISQLNTVQYHYNSQKDSDGKHFGFIAQQVQEILPNLVGSGQENTLTLNYIEMIPLLVKGIQEQQLIISQLRHSLLENSQSITNLSDRLSRLESLLSR